MHLPNSIHTAILAGDASTAHGGALVRHIKESWDDKRGPLHLEIWNDSSTRAVKPTSDAHAAIQLDCEAFASVDLLTGDARFICSRDGLSVLTNSLRFLSDIFPLSLDPHGVAEEMSRFIPERYKTRTPWTGVRRVPPGFKAYVGRDNSWDMKPLSAASSKFASAERTSLHGGQLQDGLRSAVLRSIKGASSVVADLSGGMDSTSICAILSELREPYVSAHIASSDNNNLDKRYAEIAAAALGKSICTLGDSRVVAGAFDSTFHGSPAALDEGIPTWVGGDKGYARRSIFASDGGHDLYLVGVGGDELFSMQYGALLASDGAAGGPGRYRTLLRSMSAAGTLRANARMLMTRLLSPGEEAKARLGSVNNRPTNPGDALADLGWMPGLEVPSYLAPPLRAELCANIIDFAHSQEFLLHEERFKHVIFESLIKQAKTLASVNRNFGHSELQFRAPFLDAELVTQVLALDSHEFSPRNGHKHILKKVVGDALPAAIRDRPDKGELSSELYESFAANRDTVRRHLNDSYLVDLGVVDGDTLRTLMSRSMYSTGSLMELEELYHAEKWVRAMDSKVGSYN